jgi:hypothetical protein
MKNTNTGEQAPLPGQDNSRGREAGTGQGHGAKRPCTRADIALIARSIVPEGSRRGGNPRGHPALPGEASFDALIEATIGLQVREEACGS